ncbi:phosphatase PAP2 family protein [Mesoplasma seiffertii]|uniref:phosphatase PAP2 family protein n=1 Tax=Mesoplasma seiffertii TaxID=28224 RepID=UPI00047C7D95|nr:phosphatase PAP2 family protein [Mesoplasma seiffertii]
MNKKVTFNVNFKKSTSMKTFLAIVVCLSIVLFIISSFFDIQIMEFFVDWFKFTTLKIISIVSYKIGNFIIAGLLAPTFIAIIGLVILDKYQQHKIISKLHKSRKSLIIAGFIGYLIVFSTIILTIAVIQIIDYYRAMSLSNTSSTVDVKFLASTLVTGIIDIALILIIVIINCLILGLFLAPRISNNQIIQSRYIKPIVVIIVYIFLTYLVVMILKHAFGRPFYMNVGWTKENAIAQGLNPDLSIESYYEKQGWEFNSKGVENFSNAEYYEWWQPNNVLKNWINWFTWPEKVWIDYGDHYWDMDFPSGHIFSYTALFSSTYILYFSNSYQRTKKFSAAQKSYFVIMGLLVCICAIGLMVQMFHWPTDIWFSLAVSPIAFWGSISLYNWKSLKTKKRIIK